MLNATQETLAIVKAALAAGQSFDPQLQKAVTQATGLTFYDLQAPAKNLYPIITPFRNKIPRVGRPGGFGTATNYKQITSINGSGYNAMGWVPEGQRSGRMSYTAVDKAVSYVTVGEEDSVSFEAESAAAGFEDINATATMRLLQKLMTKEEMAIIGGNRSLSLTTPTAPTVSASGTGATLAAATYVVYVVALTFEGFKNSSLAGGVATSLLITGADGQTYTLNGGSSNKSAASSGQAVTLGQTLFASTPVVNGAVAYAWYVGTAGNEKLEKITGINSAAFNTALLGTGQAATAITANNSVNANYAFDGLLTQTFNRQGEGSYVNALATGTAGTGTVLTASGRGTVVEVDNMLQSMWDNYRISPDCLFVNSQQMKDMTTKCLTNASGPLLQYHQNAGDAKPYQLAAGGSLAFYFNPFNHQGGRMIPVAIHPDCPAGTIMGWAETLPAWYQSNNTPNVAEMITRRDYYRMDWPLRTRVREYGCYAEEALAVYAPFALGLITNIAPG